MNSGSIPACRAHAGRMLRFVLGSDRLPELAFAAADTPAWEIEGAARLAQPGGEFVLDADSAPILSGTATVEPFRLEIDVGDSEILGFGTATGRASRNESRFRIMTRDTLLYGVPGASYTAMPFFIARSGERTIGVLVATTWPLDVVVAGGRVTLLAACDTEAAPVDVIVFRGALVEIMRDLAAVVGRTFLPPAWALGFHQSRWSYRNASSVLKVARRFRALDLPADAIHLDIHYMDRYRVFTFHPQRFPQPGQMHEALRDLGFRTLAIVDPGVSVAPYPVYQSLSSGDMLLTRRDGRPYEGEVWPGATVFPDFTQDRVREAWGRFHWPLLQAGVAGFWNDMNDPVFRMGRVYDPLAEDVQHHGVPHRRVRNLYANGMAEATVLGIKSLRPQARPFVLSRSGFLGIQRHAAVWTGDNHSSWQHLRENLNMVLNLGLSGVPITGADVGGFGRGPGKFGLFKPLRPSAELFVRWMELGSLMPFFRAHCTLFAPRQEPWSFGAKALELSRRLLRRRYRLLPLLYRLALEAHEEGLPIVRPLCMHFDVPKGLGGDQFLLGDGLLAAPVLQPGAEQRSVWLPAGTWMDWYSGTAHDGGREILVDAPLGKTPLFLRSGAALFLAEPRRNADETLRAPIALELTVPPARTLGRGSLFLDDGESTDGGRFVLDAIAERRDGRVLVRLDRVVETFTPAQQALELRMPMDRTRVTIDGVCAETSVRSLAAEDRSLSVAVARVPLRANEIVIE